jgi:hypothetical protein
MDGFHLKWRCHRRQIYSDIEYLLTDASTEATVIFTLCEFNNFLCFIFSERKNERMTRYLFNDINQLN